jgi:hypothetical protein
MNLAIVHPGRRPATSVEIRRSTVIAEQAFIIKEALPSPPENKLPLRAEQCYFDVDSVLLHVVPLEGSVEQMLAAATGAVAWEGDQNVFAIRNTFVRSSSRDRLRKSLNVDRLAAWNEIWATDSRSIEITPNESDVPVRAYDYSVSINERLHWMSRVDEQQAGFAGADFKSVGPEGSHALVQQ